MSLRWRPICKPASPQPLAPDASLAGFVVPDGANPKVRQLLDAANRLFLDHAYDAVSTDAIAREAKVSKATLYAYFPSKEALFATLVAEQCGQRSQDIWSTAATNDGVEEVLRSIARNFVAMFATTDALAFYRTIIAQVPRFPELGRVFYESGPKLLQDRIEEFLRAASERGELAIPDTRLAAMQFIQLVSADLPLTGLLALEPLSEDRVARTLESGITVFMRGYAPEPDVG